LEHGFLILIGQHVLVMVASQTHHFCLLEELHFQKGGLRKQRGEDAMQRIGDDDGRKGRRVIDIN